MTEAINTSPFKPETVGSIMSTVIPTCRPHDTHKNITQQLASKNWDNIDNIYIVDANNKLHGYIPIQALLQAENTTTAASLAQSVRLSLDPDADQEKAVFLAVREDIVSIPVVNDSGHFYFHIGSGIGLHIGIKLV